MRYGLELHIISILFVQYNWPGLYIFKEAEVSSTLFRDPGCRIRVRLVSCTGGVLIVGGGRYVEEMAVDATEPFTGVLPAAGKIPAALREAMRGFSAVAGAGI